MTESPPGALIASPDAVITDAQGNIWSLQDGQVVENGIPDPTTANVIALAYAQTDHGARGLIYPGYGQVWQENTSLLWWAATDAGWSPAHGVIYAPVPISADSTVITPSNPAAILDSGKNVYGSGKNVWTIIDGQVVRDGVADPTTANVIALEYKNGVIWQENADQLWWSYSQATDGSSIWTPGTVPVDRVWIGGDDNAWNPDEWSPNGAPGLGDRLTMASGTMNVYGNALGGDTLTIPSASTASGLTINLIGADASIEAKAGSYPYNIINVNASGGTSNLSIKTVSHTVNVQVDPDSTLVMNDHVSLSNFTASGGTIEFIGDNDFDAFSTTFNSSLTGTATIYEAGSTHSGQFMEVNGPVGCGLTFNLIGGPPRDVGLQIGHPEEFHGTINRMDGFVAFMGLHATSGEILDGMLKLFDGDELVNATRFTGHTSDLGIDALQLQQNSAGVMLSTQIGKLWQPGGVGTDLPLTLSS